jgi:DNA-binding response OmpR family regulator
MKKILIVEDNPETSNFYQQALQASGYTVVCANNVSTAKQLLQEPTDLVLLDIMLPGGKNGFDLLQDIKKDEKLKSIPVIMMTNLDSEEKTARAIGADDYILKTDTSLDQIVERVKKLILEK